LSLIKQLFKEQFCSIDIARVNKTFRDSVYKSGYAHPIEVPHYLSSSTINYMLTFCEGRIIQCGILFFKPNDIIGCHLKNRASMTMGANGYGHKISNKKKMKLNNKLKNNVLPKT